MTAKQPDGWKAQLQGLGGFIRSQRKLSNLSLRELADLTNVSNAYLSQIERGLHEPSVRVLRSVSHALGLPANALLEQAGLLQDRDAAREDDLPSVEAAIRADPALSASQKEALLGVYRSYRASGAADDA
jgi:transcriptional regulator with XRE-family HTH domain